MLAFAGATILYWVVRTPMILLGDLSGPSKVVHAVLALASWAVAGSALRWAITDTPADKPADTPDAGLGYSGDAR